MLCFKIDSDSHLDTIKVIGSNKVGLISDWAPVPFFLSFSFSFFFRTNSKWSISLSHYSRRIQE